ncbi:MAG: hypothetical protein E7441_01315 [Ruminococcaceae bacterium]|nr:hypothetical protein [Oscillospiraceae bacterium]
MKESLILNGVHIGEHGFDPDKIIDDIKERAIDAGFNYVILRPGKRKIFEQKYFIEWAKYLAENQIYFAILYNVQYPPEGKESWLEPETVAKMKEIAGGYFLGETIGEPGSMYACKAPDYYINGDTTEWRKDQRNYRLRFDYENLSETHEEYVKTVSKFVDINKRSGMPNVMSVDATGFARYNIEAGIDIPILEAIPGNPDILIPNVRGVAKASKAKIWGTYFAHEWYGGVRHTDVLKMKRLELAYKHAYLCGSSMFVLESGDEKVSAYMPKEEMFGPDHFVCQNYRRVLRQMQDILNTDCRPADGPKVKVAFVSGLHDGWAGKWGRSSVFNQFYREEWGYNSAEHSWMMLDELGTKRTWDDVANYGDNDTSGAPAYGQYDIIPIEASVDVLSAYDYLIFLGWNTMTEENMEKLTEYVRRGGHLLMTAAHLNTSDVRGGKFKCVSGESVEALFGCRFTGEYRKTNGGVNFKYNSLDEKVLYPTYNTGGCDPLFSAGYTEYMRFGTTTGKAIAFESNGFQARNSDLPVLIENKVGEGVATLITSTSYPGDRAIYLFYRAVVREMISASARNCDIKVIGSDRLRYSVYEGNKVYLLNTDYDLPIEVKIIYAGKEQTVRLQSLELKSIEL